MLRLKLNRVVKETLVASHRLALGHLQAQCLYNVGQYTYTQEGSGSDMQCTPNIMHNVPVRPIYRYSSMIRHWHQGVCEATMNTMGITSAPVKQPELISPKMAAIS